MSATTTSEEGACATVLVGSIGRLQFRTQQRGDDHISATLTRGEEWEPFESLVFRHLVGPTSVVFDVGANLGWYSVLAAKLGAEVVAWEPDPQTFALLLENIELNECENVRAVCAAVSDVSGTGRVSLPETNQGDHRIISSEATQLDGRPDVEVRLERLDASLGEASVDVLKLDAQGAELAVLRSVADGCLTTLTALLIKFWPAGLRSTGTTVDELFAQLNRFGLDLFEIDAERRALLRTSVEELRERSRTGRYSAEGGDHLDLLLLAPTSLSKVQHLLQARATGAPLADSLEPAQRRRVEVTVSCSDTDDIPKVTSAGAIERYGDVDVQIMHNGVRVVAGGYYGDWMTEIISRLRGHHEPQEERVFHEILGHVAQRCVDSPVIVELGAFWSYYALWFLQSFPRGRAVLVEPDPSHLAVLYANLVLNDRRATVIQAALGDPSNDQFECEDGTLVTVDRMSLAQILDHAGVSRADILVSDIQGAETKMLEAALTILADRVRFLVLSTHHESISGDSRTHQRCLQLIQQCGGHIIAEHSVDESFSGDGLIAASFEPADRDLRVALSVCRRSASLFADAQSSVVELGRHISNLEKSLEGAVEYAHSLEQHVLRLDAAVAGATAYATSLEAELQKRVTDT